MQINIEAPGDASSGKSDAGPGDAARVDAAPGEAAQSGGDDDDAEGE